MKRLLEFPYVRSKENGKPDFFDLELETFYSGSDILQFIEDIFDGKIFHDKYGNKLLLKTDRERRSFANDILNSKTNYSFIVSKMYPNEKKLFDLLLRTNAK